MRFESINLAIDFSAFAKTAGIASAVAVAILAFQRSPAGYSRPVPSIVSAIAALGIAPSLIRAIELPLVVAPAAVWVFIGLSGDGLADGLKYGFIPWLITYVLIYEIGRASCRE